jgi:hypothetical protein
MKPPAKAKVLSFHLFCDGTKELKEQEKDNGCMTIINAAM